MTSDDDYITVLPDYVYNDVTPTAVNKQHQKAVDDDDDDVQTKSLYEHPQPSEAVHGCSEQQQSQTSAYQRVITSRRDDMTLMTSDMTYDEISDIPEPPPPRPDVNQFIGVQAAQQQQQQAASSNIVYVQTVPVSGVSRQWNGRHYLHVQSKCLGTVLVIVGSICVLANVVMATSSSDAVGWYLIRAILLAMMFVLSGGFGIGAGLFRTKCMIVTFTVLCIVTVFSSLIQILAAAMAIILHADCQDPRCNQFWLAMEAIQLMASMTAAVACIWGSAVGCHGVCGCCYSNDDINATSQYTVAGDVNLAASATMPSRQQVSPAVLAPASAAFVRAGGLSSRHW